MKTLFEKLKKPRRVFGRRRTRVDSETWIVEMRERVICLHKLHARKETLIPIGALLDYVSGQKALPL